MKQRYETGVRNRGMKQGYETRCMKHPTRFVRYDYYLPLYQDFKTLPYETVRPVKTWRPGIWGLAPGPSTLPIATPVPCAAVRASNLQAMPGTCGLEVYKGLRKP